MRFGAPGRLLFALYCAEAGILLLLVPWSPLWDRFALGSGVAWAGALLLTPGVRGAVSGFGAVHLVWAAHDLTDWLRVGIGRGAARRR